MKPSVNKGSHRETKKGVIIDYIVALFSISLILLFFHKNGVPHSTLVALLVIFVIRLVWVIIRDRGRTYWIKTSENSLQFYNSVKNIDVIYSIDQMKRIDWYWNQSIGVHFKQGEPKRRVQIYARSLSDLKELKLWVKQLQKTIEERDRQKKLERKEEKLRSEANIHGDLSIPDNPYLELPNETHTKITYYNKAAFYLLIGFVFSFLFPLFFFVIIGVSIYMAIRSSALVRRNPILKQSPSDTLQKSKAEMKIIALKDQGLKNICGFWKARTVFIWCAISPVFVLGLAVIILNIVMK